MIWIEVKFPIERKITKISRQLKFKNTQAVSLSLTSAHWPARLYKQISAIICTKPCSTQYCLCFQKAISINIINIFSTNHEFNAMLINWVELIHICINDLQQLNEMFQYSRTFAMNLLNGLANFECQSGFHIFYCHLYIPFGCLGNNNYSENIIKLI